MRDLVELVDAVDLTLRRAAGLIDTAEHEVLVEQSRALRDRRGFFGETLVVALAGGTGSGKSSLLNALAAEHVASVSHLRPHTDEPLAWLPEDPEVELRRLLDDLGVERRVTQGRLPGVAVIDLPDLDSFAASHRRTVEELLPRVDAVLWLMDPEKYRDETLHRDFLAPLAHQGDSFRFVLNKLDIVDPSDAAMIRDDLEEALERDGFSAPLLFTVAAAPASGLPQGVEALAAHLESELDGKRLATARLLATAETILRDLGAKTGLWWGTRVGFTERWSRVRDVTANGLVRETGPAIREDALCQIEDAIAAMAVDGGDDFGDVVRRTITRKRIEAAVDAAVEVAPPAKPNQPNRWFRGQRSENGVDIGDVGAVLDEHIGTPLRTLVWDRARLGATIAYAAVGAAELRHRFSD